MQHFFSSLKHLDRSSLINYAFIVLILLYGLFTIVFNVRGAYSLCIIMLLLSVIVAQRSHHNYLKLLKTTPIVFWLLWVIYNYVNWKRIGIVNSSDSLQFVLTSFVCPIMTMCIVYYEGRKNMKLTATIVLIALTLYVVLGFLFGTASGSIVHGVSDTERGTSDLGNALPLNACIMSFFAIVAFMKRWINRKWLIALLGLSLFIIVFSATRKALGGLGLIVIMSLFSEFSLKKPLNLLKPLLLGVFVFFTFNYVMDETYLGERLMQTEEQGEDINDTNVQALNYLGDRAIQYAISWTVFLQHPLTGIGLRNFQVVANRPLVLHTEYMVQLCECGIIGTFLYLLFMGGLIYKVIKIYRKNKRLFYVCMGGIFCMLFINFTAWTYNGVSYFALYGLILAICFDERKRTLLSSKLKIINGLILLLSLKKNHVYGRR